jgi:excisionase family DNA binding protein
MSIHLFHLLHLLHLWCSVYFGGGGAPLSTESGGIMPKNVKKSSPGGDVANRRQSDPIKITINGVRIEVSPELEEAVHRVYQGLKQSLPREMTTTQAAAFLDVSRPFVIKLIQRGELPCRMVGKHRRIPSSALVEYREQMFQQARKAADEMTQLHP